MISASTGAKLYICSTANPTADDVSSYAALSWVEVSEIQSIAAFGDKASDISFTSLSDSRVTHLKGPRDAGSVDVVYAFDALDAGQTALRTAQGTQFSYAIKVTANDAADESATPSTFYFQAKVMGTPINISSATDVTTVTATLGIVTEITEDLTS